MLGRAITLPLVPLWACDLYVFLNLYYVHSWGTTINSRNV